jgi:protein SCO1/2
MRGLVFAFFVIMVGSIMSCNSNNVEVVDEEYECPMKCEGDQTYAKMGSCPICNMDFKAISDKPIIADKISEESIFNLNSKWATQNNETIELKALKGDVLVMVMIYTSCKAACPRLVADMRNVEKEAGSNGIKYIMVSIDPEIDTPERLKEYAIENQMDSDQWVFLNGSMNDVREFANVLSVKYKSINPIDFSHSNIISVFDQGGVLAYQEEGLGVDNKGIVETIRKLEK